MANTIEIRIDNLDELLEFCEDGVEDSDKALRATMSDVRSRSKGWIAQAVTELYTVSKGDVSGGKVDISFQGDEHNLQMIYTGSPLAMDRYSYTPTSRPGGDYNTYAEVERGKTVQVGEYTRKRTGKHVMHSSYLIMNNLTARIGKRPDPFYEKMHGPAIPSIMASDHGRPNVEKVMQEKVEERIDHEMDRFFGG